MYIYIYIYTYVQKVWAGRDLSSPPRGWRISVEVVLFKISHSMKPYPSAFPECTGKLRPAICLFEPTDLDEVSTVLRQPLIL